LGKKYDVGMSEVIGHGNTAILDFVAPQKNWGVGAEIKNSSQSINPGWDIRL
jgi:hypothetical protein